MTSINKKATTLIIVLLDGIIGASWIISIRLMTGMDMGVATRLGTLSSFILMWVVMMAAIMLPGIAPSVLKVAGANRHVWDVLMFIGSYLFVWALFGILVRMFYQSHGFVAACITAIAEGIYEVTPIKKRFRGCCCRKINSGFTFGLYCVGSTIGLMLMQIELGIMSVT